MDNITQTLIHADQTWTLWAVMIGIATISICLEQKYVWAKRVTGCMIALVSMMLLTNFKVIPTEAPSYDQVWSFIVPLSIPILLFQCNVRKIFCESGRMLTIFLISSIGTVIGTVTGYVLLKDKIPYLAELAAMFTGTYVGGSINFVALANSFHVPSEIVSAAVVADNLLMVICFLIISILSQTLCFARRSPRLQTQNTQTISSQAKNQVGLRDIAITFALAVAIVAIATEMSDFLNAKSFFQNPVLILIQQLLGNKYLLITTITIFCSTFFSKSLSKITCTKDIGTFLIYIFFAVIGAPASIYNILMKSPLLLVYALIAVLCNMIFTILVGKLFRFRFEEILLASQANIGGPTTATALAISKGWGELVAPVMLVGTLGYVLGNYYGLMVGFFLVG